MGLSRFYYKSETNVECNGEGLVLMLSIGHSTLFTGGFFRIFGLLPKTMIIVDAKAGGVSIVSTGKNFSIHSAIVSTLIIKMSMNR